VSIREFQKLSVVVPLLNEADNVENLYNRLTTVMKRIALPYELIFVDDGSSDDTLLGLNAIHERDDCVKVISLRRNYGQHPATFAGFNYASGDIIITIDADLQNDPADIQKLVTKMQDGYDVVSGWRANRQDSGWRRKLPSLIVNWFIASRTGLRLRDYGCGLKAYTNAAAKEIAQYGQADGWYPMLFGWLGLKVGEVEVMHFPRAGGKGSRYSIFAQLNQFMSLFTGLATRPFQIVELVGAGVFVAGGLTLLWMVVDWLIWKPANLSWMFVFATLWMLGGIILGVLGLIGEYLIRIYYEVKTNPKYLIRKILE
jgi:glycosyltransferase involved in cell wall biosynthesis